MDERVIVDLLVELLVGLMIGRMRGVKAYGGNFHDN